MAKTNVKVTKSTIGYPVSLVFFLTLQLYIHVQVSNIYQEQILEKHCQDRNKTCPSGPRGDKGPTGQQGRFWSATHLFSCAHMLTK